MDIARCQVVQCLVGSLGVLLGHSSCRCLDPGMPVYDSLVIYFKSAVVISEIVMSRRYIRHSLRTASVVLEYSWCMNCSMMYKSLDVYLGRVWQVSWIVMFSSSQNWRRSLSQQLVRL